MSNVDSPLRHRQCLKIAFIVDGFPERTETFISRKVDYLLRKGHDIHVYCAKYNKDVDHPKEWNSRIHVVPISRRYKIDAAIRYLWAATSGKTSLSQLRHMLAEAKVKSGWRAASWVTIAHLLNKQWDVVHAHFLTSLIRVVGLRHVMHCRVVGSVYGYDVSILPYSIGGLDSLRTQVSQVDGITYSSEFLRHLLHTFVDSDAEETILFPEVPRELFRPRIRKSPCKPLRLLTVGRLNWTKGLSDGLSCIRMLLDRGIQCEYHIIGEGEARSELEYTIRELHLDSYVKMEGAKTQGGVATAMSWADLYLLPSVREDFGTVLVEAQAAGLPIVGSKVGGTAEATQEGVTAFLVPPRDPQAMCNAIIDLVQNDNLYQSMSEAGPNHAMNFCSERIGSQLLSFYESVIESRKPDHTPTASSAVK